MKRLILSLGGVILMIALASWGFTGHKTIGQIAWNHLTPQAKEAVHELLGDETLADAATWADEVRSDPEYRATAPWHFINVPLGLSFEQFQQQVANSGQMNVYTALLAQEKQMTDPSCARAQQIAALKFITHFAGDIHQPMHVSRAEDKGGNTIQLNYNGEGTNLHALWDTKLLEHGGLNYQQLAEKYDHPTEAEIKGWQAKPPIVWAWESYQISGKLYAEVENMKGRNIGNSYYERHIGIIERRIEQAGIRLAGLLNELFKGAKPGQYGGTAVSEEGKAEKTAAAATIKIEDAPQHIGETAKICGKVYGHKAFGSMVLVNMGASYPNQLLTLVLRNDAKALADGIDNKLICVTGKLADYNGKPEIVVTDVSQIAE